MTTIERPTIDARGLNFSARAAGPAGGRPVMLLHGFPETSLAWVAVIEQLAAAGCRAVAPDQRGYSAGARPEGVDAYRMEEMVADTLAIADALGWDRFDVVGHDWGGAVAWMVGIEHPERVTTVTVASTPHPLALLGAITDSGTDQSERSGYMQFFQTPEVPERTLLADDGGGLRALYEVSGMPENTPEIDEYIAVLSEPGALTGALNWYRAMGASDHSNLGPVVVPTLYVWSSGDIALGREAAEATAQFVTGPYRFVVLDRVSHWIPEEAPAEFGKELAAHLEQYRPT